MALIIKEYEEGKNLRELGWSEAKLEEVKEQHKLRNNEAVIFANEARTRFRLVACLHGLPVLIIPPIDPEDKMSLYLKEARFLRKFKTSKSSVIESIEHEIERGERRTKRRREQAKDALERK